jgi:hypothetical protein
MERNETHAFTVGPETSSFSVTVLGESSYVVMHRRY